MNDPEGATTMPKRRLANPNTRGYGNYHRMIRRSWMPHIATGRATCVRCGNLIDPDESWDLDHADDRRDYRGPAHAACNRGAARRREHDPVPQSATKW